MKIKERLRAWICRKFGFVEQTCANRLCDRIDKFEKGVEYYKNRCDKSERAYEKTVNKYRELNTRFKNNKKETQKFKQQEELIRELNEGMARYQSMAGYWAEKYDQLAEIKKTKQI